MIYADNIAGKVAEYLLQVKAIKLQPQHPFTWASGWKSPIYCDIMIALSEPEIRDYLKDQMANVVRENFISAHAILGLAPVGIAQGIIVADYLQLPFFSIEYPDTVSNLEMIGQRSVVLIADCFTDVATIGGIIDFCSRMNIKIAGIIQIFDLALKSVSMKLIDNGILCISLVNFEQILHTAIRMNIIRSADVDLLDKWHNNVV